MPEPICTRILPATVPALFRKLDLRPISGEYGSQVRNCGCLLIALLIDAGHKVEAFEAANKRGGIGELAVRALGLNRQYAHGLMNGWDRTLPSPASGPYNCYDLGLIDGRDAFMAVAESFPIRI